MSDSPYIAVCGKCNVPLMLHPVDQCPYDYRPVSLNGHICGYAMVRKINEKNKKNQEAGTAL